MITARMRSSDAIFDVPDPSPFSILYFCLPVLHGGRGPFPLHAPLPPPSLIIIRRGRWGRRRRGGGGKRWRGRWGRGSSVGGDESVTLIVRYLDHRLRTRGGGRGRSAGGERACGSSGGAAGWHLLSLSLSGLGRGGGRYSCCYEWCCCVVWLRRLMSMGCGNQGSNRRACSFASRNQITLPNRAPSIIIVALHISRVLPLLYILLRLFASSIPSSPPQSLFSSLSSSSPRSPT